MIRSFQRVSFAMVLLLTLSPLNTGHAEGLKEELEKTVDTVLDTTKDSTSLDYQAEVNKMRPHDSPVAQEVPTPSHSSEAPITGAGILPPVLSHVRHSEGIPFPNPTDIVWDPGTPIVSDDKSDTIVMPVKPYQRPGKCEKNETLRTVDDDTAEERPPFYDLAYIPEEWMPSDPHEVFGAEVTLRPYGPDSDPSVYTRMEVHNVPCVPYRMRITNKAHYYDYGTNALRDYSKNPSARGTLHPWMQERIFGKKRRESIPRSK